LLMPHPHYGQTETHSVEVHFGCLLGKTGLF
jgi:hypothetical protein